MLDLSPSILVITLNINGLLDTNEKKLIGLKKTVYKEIHFIVR